jgi:hypothetical protein
MDLGQKSRDQPRKQKPKTSKQRTDTHSQSTPQVKRVNLIASPRETEYVESSHPFVLARGTEATTWSRSRHNSQPRSKRDSDVRRPTTPVPSLINSDAMSPPSISTISPTTPVFDTALSRPSMNRPSHNRHPTPLDFDKKSSDKHRPPPKPRTTQPDFDPASTYQPRRIPINHSSHGVGQHTRPVPSEETSFIEWDDDDSSRLQRMKQSLTFTRPHRQNKAAPTQPKYPDKQLNAVPRVIRSPKGPPQSTSAPVTYIHVPQTRSPAYNTPQQYPSPISVPKSSAERALYLPSDIPPYPIQPHHPHPQARYPEPNSTRPHHIFTTTPYPLITRQDPPQPSYTSRSRPIQSPVHPKQHQIQDHNSTPYEEKYTNNVVPKPNRFKEIVRGVAKRVSMREMRKEAAAGGARK